MQPFLEITLTNIAMATALAMLAALIARVYRRPALSHFLWLLVLLKLITPPLVPVRLALPSAMEAALVHSVPSSANAEVRPDTARLLAADLEALDPWLEDSRDVLDPNFVL